MWSYWQPTEIVFGVGSRESLPGIASRFGKRPVLVTDAGLAEFEMTGAAFSSLGPEAALFAEVEPNPTLGCVDRLAAVIRVESRDVVVALGGGSSLDCAKAACSVAAQEGSTRAYHSEGANLDGRHIPLIAVPTTAGTGSEVTPIAVLDDPDKGIKAPLVHNNFFPNVALIDPELTLTLPKYVTACTGLDALAHAIEGYWSRNHQPICDVLALKAAGLAMSALPRVLEDGSDLQVRRMMSQAALLAGMAFQIPKNAAVHACSYPLSSRYHLAHGAACAMTLDHFIRFNAPAMRERGDALAAAAGYDDLYGLADAVRDLKVQGGLPVRLSEIGVTEAEIDALVEGSFHPVMKNNPREVAVGELRFLYVSML